MSFPGGEKKGREREGGRGGRRDRRKGPGVKKRGKSLTLIGNRREPGKGRSGGDGTGEKEIGGNRRRGLNIGQSGQVAISPSSSSSSSIDTIQHHQSPGENKGLASVSQGRRKRRGPGLWANMTNARAGLLPVLALLVFAIVSPLSTVQAPGLDQGPGTSRRYSRSVAQK